MTSLTSRLLCLLLATAAAGCFETDVIDDAGFQIWCGEELCAWTVETGEIRRVPTWHEHDYAVELVGSPVHLSQAAQDSSSTCVRIELIADVAQGAGVSVAIDRDGDGRVDWTAPVNRSGFRSMSWDVRPGSSGDAVFYLRKDGEGHAVVAQLRASAECGRR
jgi:hypothetical protein